MLAHLTALAAARATVWKFRADARGVTALEYGLIAALIAVAIVTSIKGVGTSLTSTFVKIAASV